MTIRAPSATDDRADVEAVRGSQQRGGGAGRRAEVRDRQPGRERTLRRPVGRTVEPMREEVHVEAQLARERIHGIFVLGE
jgi:hypothetical protein